MTEGSGAAHEGLFDAGIWRTALENYGAVTHLTVALFDRAERLVCEPTPPTPLFEFFRRYDHEPRILGECARLCLHPIEDQPPVIVCQSYGLAAVGTSLVLEGEIAGAAVAGFALVDFCQSSALESMAHQAGIPFRQLRDVAIHVQPLPERRLVLHGQLLKVLGDTILREHGRALQLREINADLERRVRNRTSELAAANRSLGAEVRERTDAEAHVRKLLARLVVVQEDERHRIARDIHDHLGQQMTALKLRLEILRMLEPGGCEWDKQFDNAQTLVRRLDADVEFLTTGLRPLFVENLGLVRALESFVDDWSRNFRIAVRFHGRGLQRLPLQAPAEVHLFRIAQEALNNIHKHAHATCVDVRLEMQGDAVVLTVQDDGEGFDAAAVPAGSDRQGMGIVGMRERAALVQGTFRIETTPGHGTTVTVVVAEPSDAPA